MSVRRKLNQGYIQGSLLLASIVGVACESWTVFWIAASILVSLNAYSGEIRPVGKGPRERPSRGDRPRGDHFP